MSNDSKYLWYLAGLVVLVWGGVVAFWIFQSSQEAATFERLTGKHVTTWDAMWTELRVQENVR